MNPRTLGPGRLRRHLGTVRVRATAFSVLVVGLALVVAAVGLLIGVRRAFVDREQSAAQARAADLVSAIEAGIPPQDLALEDGNERFIQIVAPDGSLLAASRSAGDAPALTDVSGEGVQTPIGDADDRWVVVVDETSISAGGVLVVVGRELDSAAETTATLAAFLAVVVPAVLGVVGFTTWFLIGRALAPVEAIRREADEIGAAELDRRVPVPAGTDEIARLADTMNQMLDRLERSQARQRRFVSDASHELRSPVASIRQHVEVARLHPDRTSLDVLAEIVHAESERLGGLVDDLILLARADEASIPGVREPVDVDDLVFTEAGRVSDVIVDCSAVSGGQVSGDRRQLERVVRNLASNAACHANSAIAFSVAESNGHVDVSVDDDGPGVPPADRERVFDRFVRLDEARNRDLGGSGLGLAIVKEVIASHGGQVGVSDSPLGGARFTIRLPAQRVQRW